MSDPERQERQPAHWPPDRELRVKTVLAVGAALALATALSAVAMWYLSLDLRSEMVAKDPPPPVLIEAQMPHQPPNPRLETEPQELLRQLRAEEHQELETYTWVDEAGGIARVPIERAMELLLETRPDARAFGPPDATASSPSSGSEAARTEEASDG